jgi:hypothetical protein
MAYFNQEMKKELAPKINELLKKYNLKGTLAVRNHSAFTLNIKSGAIDFLGSYNGEFCRDYMQLNRHFRDDDFSGEARNALNEIREAMMIGNYDKSDIMSDYHNVGFYISINIGDYNAPYKVI